MIFDHVEDLDLRAVSAASPLGDEPAIWLRDVRRCFMQGLRAQADTKTLVKLSGAQTDRILTLGNDFSEAAQAFVLENDVEKNALRQEANFLGR